MCGVCLHFLKALSDIVERLALQPVNVTHPTCFSKSSEALLYEFFVDGASKILLYDQVSVP